MNDEIKSATKVIKEKNEIIFDLNKQIEYIKNERDDKIVQMKSIITQMENFEACTSPLKKPTQNPYNSQQNPHNSYTPPTLENNFNTHINKNSLFSIKTKSTAMSADKTGNISLLRTFEEKHSEIQEKIENLQNQKINLENELVIFKLKYAENSAKIMELEDRVDSLKEKGEVYYMFFICYMFLYVFSCIFYLILEIN